MGKVPEMKDDAVLRDGFPPAADEFGIHLLCILERPVAEADDVLMAEVCVRCEPDLF